jgi:TPR repeat protein
LIWLEKSYFSITNQLLSVHTSSEDEISADFTGAPELFGVLEQISTIPLAETFNSPAFKFGWDSFWRIAEANTETSHAAKWQLIDLLLNPSRAELQTTLSEWIAKQDFSADFSSLEAKVKNYLIELAESDSTFSVQAKELLIKLQPKNEALSSLWDSWLSSNNEVALMQAAELGLTIAKLTLGLRLAQFDGVSSKTSKSNASLKKAAYWIELAAKDGDRDAWFALGEIYRRPQFSGYNAAESDRCFDRAADLGHPEAQLRKGANLWRKREKIEEKVRGLQASYWVWQAHQQGVAEAKDLLAKILESTPDPKKNDWHELAFHAEKALNHHAEYKLDEEWLLMCHRLIVANQFNLSKAELLLCELGQLQHEHCVVVDIRWELPKILPRLIQIDTIQQRRTLLAAGKASAGADLEIEGNLRQRRYRFDRVTNWLASNFTKNPAAVETA